MKLLVIVSLLLCCSVGVFAQLPGDEIPRIPPELKPNEAIKQDSSQKKVQGTLDTLPGGQIVEYEYTPIQDTNYFRALRLRIPPSSRFALEARRELSNLETVRKRLMETPWQTAMRNMQSAERFFQPDQREIVQRQIAIQNAQSTPDFRAPQLAGVSMPLNDIYSFLGLTEDVSPTIKYALNKTTPVEIVVYSTSATIAAVILKEVQRPGDYEITWDGRDNKKRPLPSGDYVMEVRLGGEKFLRKRIVLGGDN